MRKNIDTNRVIWSGVKTLLALFVGGKVINIIAPADGTGLINILDTTDPFYQAYNLLGLKSGSSGVVAIIGIIGVVGILNQVMSYA